MEEKQDNIYISEFLTPGTKKLFGNTEKNIYKNKNSEKLSNIY